MTCAWVVFDVLVGINLLREGIDVPEVSLCSYSRCRQGKDSFVMNVALSRPLRAARNSEGHVIMYADTVTQSYATCYR